MEEELYALLSGALSFPIAWGTLGQGTTLPRAAMFRVSGVRDMHNQGTGLMQGRLQVDCYGNTFADAITASRAVGATLEGYAGGSILGVFLDSIRDGFEDDADLVHRVSLTFQIHYRT